ncbi:MAG: hypothetical protein ACFCA4_01520 [Cyanophyceae cyanobacterium]
MSATLPHPLSFGGRDRQTRRPNNIGILESVGLRSRRKSYPRQLFGDRKGRGRSRVPHTPTEPNDGGQVNACREPNHRTNPSRVKDQGLEV